MPHGFEKVRAALTAESAPPLAHIRELLANAISSSAWSPPRPVTTPQARFTGLAASPASPVTTDHANRPATTPEPTTGPPQNMGRPSCRTKPR